MKSFVAREADENFPIATRSLITQVCSGDGRGNLLITDIRERIKILDAVEASKGATIEIEDHLHAKLCEMLKVFPFAYAHRGLLNIIDDILEAKEADAQQTGG